MIPKEKHAKLAVDVHEYSSTSCYDLLLARMFLEKYPDTFVLHRQCELIDLECLRSDAQGKNRVTARYETSFLS